MSEAFKNITAPYSLKQIKTNGDILHQFFRTLTGLKSEIITTRLNSVGKIRKLVAYRHRSNSHFMLDEISLTHVKDEVDRITLDFIRVEKKSLQKPTVEKLIEASEYFGCKDNGVEAYLISTDSVKAIYESATIGSIISDLDKLLVHMKANSYILLFNQE